MTYQKIEVSKEIEDAILASFTFQPDMSPYDIRACRRYVGIGNLLFREAPPPAPFDRILGHSVLKIKNTPLSHLTGDPEIQQLEGIEDHTYFTVVQVVGDHLLKLRKELGLREGVVYDMRSEGFQFNVQNLLHHINMYYQSNLQIKNVPITVISAASPHPINKEYYLNNQKKFNWSDVGVICTEDLQCGHAASITPAYSHGEGVYELSTQKYIDNVRYNYEILNLNSKLTVKPYRFIFYNNHPKMNRLYLLGQIVRRVCHPYGLISMNGLHDSNFDDVLGRMKYGAVEKTIFPRTGTQISECLELNRELVTQMHLDFEGGVHTPDSNYVGFQEANIEHFSKAYFGICTETKFFHDITMSSNNEFGYPEDGYPKDDDIWLMTPDTNFIDCITFTEKTWKFIAGKVPFILAGMPGSLKVLRDMGYKTFHPYINEGYDNIVDDEQRMVAIANEIEKLCHMSEDAILKLVEDLLPITNHNFETFYRMGNAEMYMGINPSASTDRRKDLTRYFQYLHSIKTPDDPNIPDFG